MVAKKRVEVSHITADSAGDDAWKELTKSYANDPRLDHPVIYSLPTKLLKLIRKYLPSFLTAKETHFEQRLRELSGSGFRKRQAFTCEIFDLVVAKNSSERRDQLFRRIELGTHDLFAADPERLAKTRNRLMVRFAERLRGFAGWLVTNPQFRSEAAKLEEQWEAESTLRGSYPDLKTLDTTPRYGHSPEALQKVYMTVADARNFLQRWNLVRMDTWDLPVPISPVNFTSDPLPHNELRSMGVSLFVPWSLLADRDLKFDELVAYHYDHQNLSHLNGWIAKGPTTSWGVERHAKMFALFVYVERALKTRYPGRLRGHTSKLDLVFRDYWGPATADLDALKSGAETVRKTREELQKRLKTMR